MVCSIDKLIKNNKKIALSLVSVFMLFFVFPLHSFAEENEVLTYKPLNLEEKTLELDTKTTNIPKSDILPSNPNINSVLDKNSEYNKLNKKDLDNIKKSLQNYPNKAFVKPSKNSQYNQLVPKPDAQNKNQNYGIDDDFEFNLDFLHSGNNQYLSKNLGHLLQADIPPGKYSVNVSVNRQSLGSFDILFKLLNKKLAPCVTLELLESLNLDQNLFNNLKEKIANNSCLFLSSALEKSNYAFNTQKFELDIWLPDVLIAKLPNSAFDKKLYDFGANSLFVRYNLNHYATKNLTTNSYIINQSNLNLVVGANLGPLHLRHASNFSDNILTKNTYSYGYTYGQFDIPTWYSQFKFGEISANTKFVNSTNILGFNIFSDDKMLPIQKKGYAPEIKGFAKSNALVKIKENGREIYTRNVAKGEFVIDDLHELSRSNDLEMVIQTNDGEKTKTLIPYYNIRPILRKNAYKYNVSLGFYDKNLDILWHEPILSTDFEYGVLNSLTLGGGLSLNLNRQEFGISATYNSFIGSFMGDINFAHSKMHNKNFYGASFGISYSNFFSSTNTNLTLAAYRFTMKNYFYLDSVIYANNSDQLQNIILENKQKNNFSIYLGQNLPWNLGSLYFSTNLKNYWDIDDLDLYVNLGYSFRIKQANFRFNYFRNQNLSTNKYTNTIVFSLSMPFDTGKIAKGNFSTSLYLYPNKSLDDQATYTPFQHNISLSSTNSLIENLSYNLNISNYNNNEFSLSSSLNWKYKKVNVNANFGYSSHNTLQYSFNLNGALVLHEGGINFSNYLGDTFAIVKVLDGKGAKLQNSSDIFVDSNGYGIIPSLSPYYKNTIYLDTKNLPLNYEFNTKQNEIIPGNMASPLIEFVADKSPAVFLQLNYINAKKQKENVPVGAFIINAYNEEISFVGMAGRTYLKQKNINSTYKAIWGDTDNESCSFTLNLSDKELNSKDINIYKVDCM